MKDCSKGFDYTKTAKRFEVWLADLGERKGSVQRGIRPVLVISNDRGNKHSNIVVAVAISSSVSKAKLPTHYKFKASEIGFKKDSTLLCEQIFTLSKDDLMHKITTIPEPYHQRLNRCIQISLDLEQNNE